MEGKGEEVEQVLVALGGGGRYQHFQHIVIAFSALASAFQLLDMIFIGRMVSHQCAPIPNGTNLEFDEMDFSYTNYSIRYQKCNIDVQFNTSSGIKHHTSRCVYGMQYSEKKHISAISEFDLVCERAALGDLPQTLLILGQSIGALSLPFFSDRFGRKPIHIISQLCVLVIGISIAFSPNYLVFFILRFVMGAVQQGVVLTCATFTIEIYPRTYRRYVGLIGGLVWGFCVSAITPFGYFLRNHSWRTQQLAFCSVSAYLIFQIMFLDESFRWLMANGRHKQALRILKKAAKMNKVDIDVVMEKFNELVGARRIVRTKAVKGKQMLLSEQEIKEPVVVEKYSMFDILKRRRLALNTFVLWYLWCTAALSYFGLFFTSSSLVGNRFMNFFLYALMEIPPSIVFFLIVDRYGRKHSFVLFYGMCGVGMLVATILKSTTSSYAASICITLLSLIAKIGAGGAFGACFFYTPEIFPTNLRNVGLGSASIAARVGGMLGPFSRFLAEHVPWGPAAVFGGCCLLATVLVTLLPETNGKELPQTMADMKLLYQSVPNKEEKKETKQTK